MLGDAVEIRGSRESREVRADTLIREADLQGWFPSLFLCTLLATALDPSELDRPEWSSPSMFPGCFPVTLWMAENVWHKEGSLRKCQSLLKPVSPSHETWGHPGQHKDTAVGLTLDELYGRGV